MFVDMLLKDLVKAPVPEKRRDSQPASALKITFTRGNEKLVVITRRDRIYRVDDAWVVAKGFGAIASFWLGAETA